MKTIIFVLLLFLIFCIGGYLIIGGRSGFEITIHNQTSQKISGLYITYENIEADIKIPAIHPGQTHQLNVTPTEDFGENTMNIYYKDQNGNEHTEVVIGYFEKGYSGEANITLKLIDEDGVIQMQVKEKLD